MKILYVMVQSRSEERRAKRGSGMGACQIYYTLIPPTMSECVRVRACVCTYNPKAQPSPPLPSDHESELHAPRPQDDHKLYHEKRHTPGRENPRPPGADCEGGSMRSDAFSPSLPALPGFLALAECLLFLFLAERCLWCLGSGLSARVGRGSVLRGESLVGTAVSPTPIRRSFCSLSLSLSQPVSLI